MVVITHNITSAQDAADYCGILHKGRLVRFSSIEEMEEEVRGYIVLTARKDPEKAIASIDEGNNHAFCLSDSHVFS